MLIILLAIGSQLFHFHTMELQDLLLLLSLASFGWLHAAAAPPPGNDPGSDLPPGSSGALRGGEDLLGAGGEPINPADTAIVSNPQLVPGQKDTSTLGVYLDFEDVDQPQPVRGSRGGTDPGHRKKSLMSPKQGTKKLKVTASMTSKTVISSLRQHPILVTWVTVNGLWD